MLKFLSLSLSAALLSIAGPALAAPDEQPAPTEKPSRTSTSAPRGLMRYDTNKDGTVDAGEWKTAQEARFERLDANSDGMLVLDELLARTRAAANSGPPSDRQMRRRSSYFQLLDADKDGTATLTEFMAQGERNFARCDLDSNGLIDTAECRQALRRKSAVQ